MTAEDAELDRSSDVDPPPWAGVDAGARIDGRPVWSDEQELVAEALARGATHAAAGRLIHRSAKTVQRYLKDPDFRDLVSDRRSDHVRATTGRLVSLGDSALTVLEQALADEALSMRARLDAARYVVDAQHRQHRAHVVDDDLVGRLERLELNFRAPTTATPSVEEWRVDDEAQ